MQPEAKIQLIHPEQGKQGPRISALKYDLVKRALLQAIPNDPQGTPFKGLEEKAATFLTPDERANLGSLAWYLVSVKLDLEARGVIERVPGVKPQRMRKVNRSM